jgi:hypothetical protein
MAKIGGGSGRLKQKMLFLLGIPLTLDYRSLAALGQDRWRFGYAQAKIFFFAWHSAHLALSLQDKVKTSINNGKTGSYTGTNAETTFGARTATHAGHDAGEKRRRDDRIH